MDPAIIIYIVVVICTGIFSAAQLKRLADPYGVSFLVLGITWYAWLMSLSVIALVPIDVLFTVSDEGNVGLVDILWKVSYWSTQVCHML